jgi:hypothetical protein
MLQGLLPVKEETLESLQRILLDGRYCEIRMLYYLGKDTDRWIEQCIGVVEREPKLCSAGLRWQSFASLIVNDPPCSAVTKLKTWGVADHRSIFSRGLALNSVFADAPSREALSEEFIRNYHQYADQVFACRMNAAEYTAISSAEFSFDLYASGEYTAMLEREWQNDGSAR